MSPTAARQATSAAIIARELREPRRDRCISFGSLRVDQAVGAEVVRLLKPLGIEAALQAIEQRTFEAAGSAGRLNCR